MLYLCSSNTGISMNMCAVSANTVVAGSQWGSNNSHTHFNSIDYFKNMVTCIPPPAISGQYFLGNVMRPNNLSIQTSTVANLSPVLSRLPLPAKGKIRTEYLLSFFHQCVFICVARLSLKASMYCFSMYIVIFFTRFFIYFIVFILSFHNFALNLYHY